MAHAIDALLDFADAGEVFVELAIVLRADLAAQAGGLVLHAIENAERALVAPDFEKAVERQRWIDFHRHR
jgi:hypothetical protein